MTSERQSRSRSRKRSEDALLAARRRRRGPGEERRGSRRRPGEDVDVFRRDLDSRHPVGHVGEPDDIAAGIVYLPSGEATFVTGSELVIDGGYTAQ